MHPLIIAVTTTDHPATEAGVMDAVEAVAEEEETATTGAENPTTIRIRHLAILQLALATATTAEALVIGLINAHPLASAETSRPILPTIPNHLPPTIIRHQATTATTTATTTTTTTTKATSLQALPTPLRMIPIALKPSGVQHLSMMITSTTPSGISTICIRAAVDRILSSLGRGPW